MTDTSRPGSPTRAMILPLALAQFICSYAATNMNVAISSIAKDLNTTVLGLQTTITLFTLTMASLMIPGSKLTVIWGRKRCFAAGLLVYGVGALLGALAPGLGVMIFGYSFLQGIGSALLIPPIYILVTVTFTDIRERARNFGIISGAGGLGAAAGPLIGGVITTAIGWRASFVAQVLVVAWIVLLSRRIADPGVTGPKPSFDIEGAVLCGVGLFFVVLGILQSSTYGWFASRKDFSIGGTVLIPKGGVSLVWPFVAVVIMQGTFFVASVFLQKVRGYNAIETGLVLTPATVGILISSAGAERFAKRHSQPWIIRVGFAMTAVGIALLLALVREKSNILTFVPGLLLMGAGVGAMLTSSVNVVQSAFPEADQGDISGLSRSASNLGSSLGTALAGSIIAAEALPGNKSFALSIVLMLVITLIGLAVALLLPRQRAPAPAAAETPSITPAG